jgi:phosphatidate cytidylyltransferase
MHSKRILVAGVLLPLFYLSIMGFPDTVFFCLLLTASILAQWEFYAMYRVDGLMRYAGILLGALLLAAAFLSTGLLPHVLMFSVMTAAAARLFGRKDPVSSLRDLSPSLLGLFYIPGLLVFQLPLRERGPEWIIFLWGCVWASDSAALYAGKAFGRRKLYQAVSPNKTVEGAVGSLAGGAFSGWLLNVLLLHSMSLAGALLTGLVIGAITIVGDLVESMFKRDAGVKDSSTLIPGHGGVLDKIDGVLFAGPVFYWVSLAAGVLK